MMSELDMPGEANPDLRRLFATADETLPAEPFASELARRLEGQQRLRLFRRSCMVIVLLTAGALAAPFVSLLSLELARVATKQLADLLISPWAVAASPLIGVLVLLRMRARYR
jgi:hypothetical protein